MPAWLESPERGTPKQSLVSSCAELGERGAGSRMAAGLWSDSDLTAKALSLPQQSEVGAELLTLGQGGSKELYWSWGKIALWVLVLALDLHVSQNHRMVGVGRDLCGSPSPTPQPKQGHLQQAAQDRVQAGLEYLQRGRLHNLPGQPVPGLHHPQSEVLPHVQVELPLLQFVPVAPCPVTGHH